MQNAEITGWRVFGALCLLMLIPEPSYAAEDFEGLWAKTHRECLDEEGPNSRTFIALGHLIDGKPSPIFDQYENHCRIERTSRLADGVSLSVTCFEFWEDFTKGVEGTQATIRLSPVRRNTLGINGTPYRRCKAKAAGQ